MKFLIDKVAKEVIRKWEKHPDLICGQLITPLTRYTNYGGVFAIDNGGFSSLERSNFETLLDRERDNTDRCLFVAVPDIVFNARRTLELWRNKHSAFRLTKYKLAFVVQDGMEDLDIPWHEMDAVFIGGSDNFKDSRCAVDIVKAGKALGKHVHAGRVNEFKRFKVFHEAGADTCDGSGIAMYDHMLEKLESMLENDSQQISLIEQGAFE
jgi:hypothetical protein